MAQSRNYKKEYKRDHSSKTARKNRSNANKARRKLGLKKGDPREVDHKKPMKKGGTNAKSNLRIVSRATNRRKGTKTKRS